MTYTEATIIRAGLIHLHHLRSDTHHTSRIYRSESPDFYIEIAQDWQQPPQVIADLNHAAAYYQRTIATSA